MLLDRAIQVRDIRLVMLVVMQLHRRFVDIRLKRSVVVGQRWKFVGHRSLSFAIIPSDAAPPGCDALRETPPPKTDLHRTFISASKAGDPLKV